MAQSSQNLREQFQRHIKQELAALPSRSAEHREAFAQCIQKFTKTGDRCLRQFRDRRIQTLSQLLDNLPELPRKLKDFSISLLAHHSQPILELASRRSPFFACRWACPFLESQHVIQCAEVAFDQVGEGFGRRVLERLTE